jgi:hypothetical protein
MSRTRTPVTGRLAAPRPASEWTAEEQAERLRYSTLPEIAGIDGAVEFARDVLRVEVSSHYIPRAVGTHRLARHVVGHRQRFCPRDLFTLVVLESRRTGPAPRRGGVA